MPETPLTLTIDIGTSSTRVMLWDTQGAECEGVRAQTPYVMHTAADGTVEMSAEELLAHVSECMDTALAQAGDRTKDICAVGISCFWHALLGCDKSGNALTPVYNWADTRAAQAALLLRNALDVKAVHARTGCVIHPSYYPAKIAWLRHTQSALFEQIALWASPGEYLFRQWFGEAARNVSVSIASGTGLMNQASSAWDTETLNDLQMTEEKLAPIADLKQSVQGLQGEFATRWPALRDVPFFLPVGDGACGNVGSGCATPDRFAINVGTSGAIRVLWNEDNAPLNARIAPFGLWKYRVDKQRPLMGAAFSDGGNVFAWLSKILQLPPMDALETLLAGLEPGAHGLLFLPFLGGERSLGWNPDAHAALLGMNLGTDAPAIVHAALEAVALRFALAAQSLRAVFPQAKQVIASGGALGKSPAWSQIFADALGQPLTLAEEPEASSRGAALLAMEAAGLIPSIAAPEARLGRTFAPDSPAS